MEMETLKHGDMETWRDGDMETLRHGDMEKLRHGDNETWKHVDDMETSNGKWKPRRYSLIYYGLVIMQMEVCHLSVC
jgi:hypothetical protein